MLCCKQNTYYDPVNSIRVSITHYLFSQIAIITLKHYFSRVDVHCAPSAASAATLIHVRHEISLPNLSLSLSLDTGFYLFAAPGALAQNGLFFFSECRGEKNQAWTPLVLLNSIPHRSGGPSGGSERDVGRSARGRPIQRPVAQSAVTRNNLSSPPTPA